MGVILNNKLVEELEQLITLMLNKITDYVQHDLATKVQTEVRTIQTQFQDKPNTTKSLVEAYDYLEDVKTKKRNDIVKDYNDVIEWMSFLYRFP